MGELDFLIYKIVSNEAFILSDRSSFTRRSRINEYFNPDALDVSKVGIPLTDKIFILATSRKVKNSKSGFRLINVVEDPLVFKINSLTFQMANKAVATSNKDYLQKFITRKKGCI